MKDLQQQHPWPLPQLPPACRVWALNVGHLTGFGQSHYAPLPDYVCPHLVVAGEGVVRTRAGEWPVHAGDMFCLWPGVAIDYRDTAVHPWQFYWIHLIGDDDRAFAEACGFSATRPVVRPAYPERVARAVQALYDYYGEQESHESYHALSLLYGVAAACQTQQHQAYERADLALEAAALIGALHTPAVNVTDLAHTLRVSRSSLLRAFHAQFGMGPSAYLQQARLDAAKRLLRQSDFTVSAVALAAGFANEKYFLRCFRAAEGMTPSQWRAQMRQRASGID
ncbi:MAG TPA: AraC family transcriptional regulator [Armatimonadota bacterium]|jgi:AraC-like DNA-binding protein